MDVDFNGILVDVFNEDLMNICRVCGLQWSLVALFSG
jgi:hypothetical protein